MDPKKTDDSKPFDVNKERVSNKNLMENQNAKNHRYAPPKPTF